MTAVEPQPARALADPLRKNAPSGASPFAIMQRRGQALQPCGRNSGVVIHECEDIAHSSLDSRVAGVGMAWLRLKQVTEATRVLADEVRDNLARLVARVVVNYD